MTCDFCHLTYIESEADDRRLHRERHRQWEKAATVLGYLPQSYQDREEDKLKGHRSACDGQTLEVRLAGAERVLRAWFDRSLSSAIENGYWRKHPDFQGYVAAIEVPHAFTPEIWAALRRRYGRRLGVIPTGYSYWYPDTTGSRSRQTASGYG